MNSMKSIICGNPSNKLTCDECINKKICSECYNQSSHDDFYIHKKTLKPFNKCKSCFNKKIKCEICNKEINKTYNKRHKEICVKRVGAGVNSTVNTGTGIELNTKFEPTTYGSTVGDFVGASVNRTLIVGPCFCGKTFLIMKILQGLTNIVIITRSPEQYEDSARGVNYIIESPEEIKDLEEYRGKIVVFDDMLDHKH